MAQKLENKKIAVLVTHGFEQSEFEKPIEALRNEAGQATVISPEDGKIKAWHGSDWGDEFDVDMSLNEANAENFDALLLPGGVMNPDLLRQNKEAVGFVRTFFEQHKPVASICHGPWMLIEADVVQGRKVTSFPSIKTDLMNAGAQWVDEEVVVDEGLVTSRNPDDLDAFCSKMVEEFCEGEHEGQSAEGNGRDHSDPSEGRRPMA